ncbi:MAG: acetate kinase [Christensenellaceae bacterium]|jgi:acetate kinase|nr:acetate kinase [Christensenellaceae bacterium]
MKVLVINAGSSSLKYQLIQTDTGEVLAKGLCERIGIGGSKLTYKPTGKGKYETQKDMKDHTEAISMVIRALSDPETGVVRSMDEIDAVGHRLVHGGEAFSEAALITDEMLRVLEALCELAPLHNPANLMGIRACQTIMPNVPMVGVFDTAFHQTMPPEAFLYGLPYEAYTDLQVRRYGFHGISHSFISQEAIAKLDKPAEETRVITCHLGNGSSMSAIKGGKSVDNSMGFTPLPGVTMGTRCGDIDPAIVIYLMDKLNLDTVGINAYLNKQCGVQGISGVSSDFRDLWTAAEEGNRRAELALRIFAYHVKRYIGAYAAVLGGVDAIVFSAGVGENDSGIRALAMEGLEYLGVDMDYKRNETLPRGEEGEISKPGSKVKVFVIPTDEELVIAKETARLAAK